MSGNNAPETYDTIPRPERNDYEIINAVGCSQSEVFNVDLPVTQCESSAPVVIPPSCPDSIVPDFSPTDGMQGAAVPDFSPTDGMQGAAVPEAEMCENQNVIPASPVPNIEGKGKQATKKGAGRGRRPKVLPPPPPPPSIHSEEDFQEMRRHLDGVLQNIISKVTKRYVGRKRNRSRIPPDNDDLPLLARITQEQQKARPGIKIVPVESLLQPYSTGENEVLPSPETDDLVEDSVAFARKKKRRPRTSQPEVFSPVPNSNIETDIPEELFAADEVALKCNGLSPGSATSGFPSLVNQVVANEKTVTTCFVDEYPPGETTSSTTHSQEWEESQECNIRRRFSPFKYVSEKWECDVALNSSLDDARVEIREETDDTLATSFSRSASSPSLKFENSFLPLPGTFQISTPESRIGNEISEITNYELTSPNCGENSLSALPHSEDTERTDVVKLDLVCKIRRNKSKLTKTKSVPPWRRSKTVEPLTREKSHSPRAFGADKDLTEGPVEETPSLPTSTPQKPERRKKRQPSASAVAPICGLCGRGFSSFCDLNSHWRLHVSSSRRFFCSLCKQRFMHAGALATHARRRHDVDLLAADASTDGAGGEFFLGGRQRPFAYSCSDCGSVFMWMAELAVHLQLEHEAPMGTAVSQIAPALLAGSRMIGIAPGVVHRRGSLSDGVSDRGSPRPLAFSCGDCGRMFKEIAVLERHRQVVHGHMFDVWTSSDGAGGRDGLVEDIAVGDVPASVHCSRPSSRNQIKNRLPAMYEFRQDVTHSRLKSQTNTATHSKLKVQTKTAKNREEKTSKYIGILQKSSSPVCDVQSISDNNAQGNTHQSSHASHCDEPALRRNSVSPVSVSSRPSSPIVLSKSSSSVLSLSSSSVLSISLGKDNSHCSEELIVNNSHVRSDFNADTPDVIIDKTIPSLNCPRHSKTYFHNTNVTPHNMADICPVHKVLFTPSSSFKKKSFSLHPEFPSSSKECFQKSKSSSSHEKPSPISKINSELSKIPPCHRKPLVCIPPLPMNSLQNSGRTLSPTKPLSKSTPSTHKPMPKSVKHSLSNISLHAGQETMPFPSSASSPSKAASSKKISRSFSVPGNNRYPTVVLERIDIT